MPRLARSVCPTSVKCRSSPYTLDDPTLEWLGPADAGTATTAAVNAVAATTLRTVWRRIICDLPVPSGPRFDVRRPDPCPLAPQKPVFAHPQRSPRLCP